MNARADVHGTLKQATSVTPKNIPDIFVNRTRLYLQPCQKSYALSVSVTAKRINSQASLSRREAKANLVHPQQKDE